MNDKKPGNPNQKPGGFGRKPSGGRPGNAAGRGFQGRGTTSGGRSFQSRGTGAPAGERKYPSRGTGAPSSGERSYPSRGTGAPAGERKYPSRGTGAPSSGERSYPSRGTGAPTGERKYPSRGTGAQSSGERSYPSRGTSAPTGERKYPSHGTGAPSSGERKYPSRGTGAPSGERRFPSRSTGAPVGGPRRFPARPVRPAADKPEESTGVTTVARRFALTVLTDVHENGAYASLSLNERLPKANMKPEDRRLVTELIYGTLENETRIDYALDKLMEHPTREAVQRDILRLSAYQILFLDRIPDSAAVNEAVKLVKVMGMEGASGFINAVLRNLVRGKDSIEWPKKEDDFRLWLHVMSSTPLWLVDRLVADYGPEEAESILMSRDTAHPVVVRPNMTKLSDEEFEKLLAKKELRFSKGIAPHAYLVSGASELAMDADYQAGLFSIQGQSSMLAAEALQVKPGMKVLDACAAPGGKSAYLCERMEMTGRVYAWELHEKRAMLLEGARRRLKLENLRVMVRNAAEPREDWDATLDAVLLDAPCSGTGVMRQKPDIKLRLKETDLPSIAQTQKNLLNTLCAYVKPKGLLVYSTCSILPMENAEQIKAFLDEHPNYTLEPLPLSIPESLRAQQGPYGLQLLGYRDHVEGFFIAALRRTR